MFFSENSKIGIAVLSIGLGFYFLGFLFMLDRALLCLANFAFITGLCLLVGVQGTIKFLTRPAKMKGSIAFLAGFILIVIGKWGFTLAGFLV